MHSGVSLSPVAVRSNLKIWIFIGEKRRRPFGQIRRAQVERASKPCFQGGPWAPASHYFYPHRCHRLRHLGMVACANGLFFYLIEEKLDPGN